MTQKFEEAKSFFLKGLEFQQQNLLHEAESMYLQSLGFVPDRASTLVNLSVVQLRLGKTEEARQSAEKASAVEAGNAATLAQLGAIYLEMRSYETAISRLEAAVKLDPRLHQALGNLALAFHRSGAFKEAFQSFTRLVELKPDHAPAFYNRAITLLALGRLDESLADLERAIALRLVNAEIYILRGNVLKDLGRIEEALASYSKALEFRTSDAEAHSNRGNALLALKRSDEALLAYDTAIALKPDYAPGHFNRGNALKELSRFEEALASYGKAIALKQDFAEAHCHRGIVLQEVRRLGEALASHDKAIALRPGYAEAYSQRGTVLLELGRLDEALASHDKAIALKPDFAAAYVNRGIGLAAWGRIAEAETAFREAFRADAHNIMAFKGLAQLLALDISDPIVKAAERMCTGESLPAGEKMQLCFGLGALYDKAGRFDKAFEFFKTANAIERQSISYDIDVERQWQKRICSALDRAYFDSHPHSSFADDTPVFVVGMPRSGTTLMEQVLAAHSMIEGAGELPIIGELLKEYSGRHGSRYPDCMQHLTAFDLDAMGREYVKRARSLAGKAMVPRIIDKMPHNFLYLGLIRQILPATKVIYMLRHPLDIVTSIYSMKFSGHHPYAYDLEELSEYVLLSQQIMAHWSEALPGWIYVQDYSKLVGQPEQEIRKVLDFLGLPFEEACLEPQKVVRYITTSSVTQVRQPINRKSLERWRNYESHYAGIASKFPGQ